MRIFLNLAAADIGVLWDLDYCPIPVGLTPASVSQNIKLALKNMGYTGPVSISAYSIVKQTKEDFESAQIRLCYTEYSELKGIFIEVDAERWATDICPKSNLMLISKDVSENSTCINTLLELKDKGNNILLAQPQIAVGLLRTIPSAIWLWTSLSAGKSPLHNQSESGSSQVVAPCLTSSPRTESSLLLLAEKKKKKKKKKKKLLADKKKKKLLAVVKKRKTKD